MRNAIARMMTQTLGALSLVVLALPASVARADENTPTGIVRGSDVIGKEVKNGQDESLGKIHDLVFDVNSGEVIYMVLAHGQTLGLGGKWFAVPSKAYTFTQDKDHLILDVPATTLEQSKGFTDDAWPNKPDHTLVKGEARDDKDADEELTLMRFSKLKGADVVGRDKKSLGSVNDAALNVKECKVNYVAMGTGGVLGVGQEWFPISLEDLEYSSQNNNFQVNAVEADFENRKGIGENWPEKADRRYERKDK